MPINYKNYPENWKTEIVPAIRKRSGDMCENCGLKNKMIISRLKDGSYTTPGGQDWNMINAKVKEGVFSLAQSLKLYGFHKVVLTTAHYDHDQNNNQYDSENKDAPGNNLFHWCQKCHLFHDRYQHAANRANGRNWKINQLKLNL